MNSECHQVLCCSGNWGWQGLILILNTHVHSLFLGALIQQVQQHKTFWCRGKWGGDLELESADNSLRIGLLPDLAQSVMTSGGSAGLLNKVNQFNWNHRFKSHFCQMSAWCVVSPVFCEDCIWKQHRLCTGTAGKASSHWDWSSSAASAFAVVTASCTAQSTQSKVGVMNALSTAVSGFCNPRNNLSFSREFKTKIHWSEI